MIILIIRELQHSPIVLLKVEHSVENIDGFEFEFYPKVLFHPNINVIERETYDVIYKFIDFYKKYGNKNFDSFIVVSDSSSPVIYVRPTFVFDNLTNIIGVNVFGKVQGKYVIYNPRAILNAYYVSNVEFIKRFYKNEYNIVFSDGELYVYINEKKYRIDDLENIIRVITKLKTKQLKF